MIRVAHIQLYSYSNDEIAIVLAARVAVDAANRRRRIQPTRS